MCIFIFSKTYLPVAASPQRPSTLHVLYIGWVFKTQQGLVVTFKYLDYIFHVVCSNASTSNIFKHHSKTFFQNPATWISLKNLGFFHINQAAAETEDMVVTQNVDGFHQVSGSLLQGTVNS